MKTSLALRSRTDLVLGGALPRVNLLPPEIDAARRFRRVQAGLALAVAAAVGVVSTGCVLAGASVSHAQSSLDAAHATTSQLQQRANSYSDVTATYRRAADARALLVAAMGQEVRYSRVLADLPSMLPDGLWITSVTVTQGTTSGSTGSATGTSTTTRSATTPTPLGTVTFSGMAGSHPQVAAWLDALAQEKGFSSPSLTSSAESLLGSSTKVVQFTTSVTLTSDALSGRFTSTGS